MEMEAGTHQRELFRATQLAIVSVVVRFGNSALSRAIETLVVRLSKSEK